MEEILQPLRTIVARKGYSLNDLQHMLRVASQSGVDTQTPADQVLQSLMEGLSIERVLVLLTHAEAILAHYDEIMVEGGDLKEAIQDFMARRVPPGKESSDETTKR